MERTDSDANLEPAPKPEIDWEFSANIHAISEALAIAQGQMKPAVKSKINSHLKSQYADLNDCWEAARTPLSKNGLAVTQFVATAGKTVKVMTLISHKSGQWMRSVIKIDARDTTAQQIGATTTYARRIAFCALVGVTPDEDDDGDTAQNGPSNVVSHQVPAQATNPERVFTLQDQGMVHQLRGYLTNTRGITDPNDVAVILNRMVGLRQSDLNDVLAQYSLEKAKK